MASRFNLSSLNHSISSPRSSSILQHPKPARLTYTRTSHRIKAIPSSNISPRLARNKKKKKSTIATSTIPFKRMNLENANTVQELQRQLEAANARNSQLEQFVQSQFRGDPTVLNQVAQNLSLAQPGFQIPSHGLSSARSSGLSRSKSTITYPTQVKSAITVIHPKPCAISIFLIISIGTT